MHSLQVKGCLVVLYRFPVLLDQFPVFADQIDDPLKPPDRVLIRSCAIGVCVETLQPKLLT